jgi:hypothetical protein
MNFSRPVLAKLLRLIPLCGTQARSEELQIESLPAWHEYFDR